MHWSNICERCGCEIGYPVPRGVLGPTGIVVGYKVVCTECTGEAHRRRVESEHRHVNLGRYAVAADRQYHGGRFYSGEW